MSATYRQQSDANEELLQKDPSNLLLARFTRMRMPAEMVRDQALAASGLLVRKIGGPSVYPYQPRNMWDGFNAYDYPTPDAVPADAHHRRAHVLVRQAQRAAPDMAIVRPAGSRRRRRRAAGRRTRRSRRSCCSTTRSFSRPTARWRAACSRPRRPGCAADEGVPPGHAASSPRRRRWPPCATTTTRSSSGTRRDREAAVQLVSVGVTPVDRVSIPCSWRR